MVMITKSEEEMIMEEAIGSKIADYAYKAGKSSQILLSVKKILDNKRLISEKTAQGYQQDFRNIGMAFADKLNYEEWKSIYKRLVYWELELGESEDTGMEDVLMMQKQEANHNFTRFINDNYRSCCATRMKMRRYCRITCCARKFSPSWMSLSRYFLY